MNTKLKLALNSIVLLYMYLYTISGLDLKLSEEYLKYMYFEFVLLVSFSGILTGYIWKTRDRKKGEITDQEKQRRYTCLLKWIIAYYFSSLLFIFYTNILENNDINNYFIFYIFAPLYICIGVSTFLYGKTRLFLIREEENVLSLMFEPIMIISTTFPALSHKPLHSIIICSILISIAFIYTIYQCFISSSLQNIFKKMRK